MSAPRTPREEWEAIVAFAEDDPAEMSEAEVEAQLAAAGFDVAAENETARAQHEASLRAGRPRRPGPSAWLAAPAAMLVTIGALGTLLTSVSVGTGAPPDAAPPPRDAGADAPD